MKKVHRSRFVAIGYFGNTPYNVKMSDLEFAVPTGIKEISEAVIGVYDESTLELSNVNIKADDKTKKIPRLFYGQDVTDDNTLKMQNVTISDISLDQIVSVLKNVEIDGLKFEGNVSEFLLSHISGTVENSSFKFTNTADEKIRAVIRLLETDELTMLNSEVTDIPANVDTDNEAEKDTQIALYDETSKIYMDDKTSSYFADEAMAKITAAEGYYKDGNEIKKSNSVFNDTASANGVTVKLDGLRLNDYEGTEIDHTADATYDVVVSTVKRADKTMVEEIAKDASNNGQEVIAYDITVTKTVDGNTEEVAVKKQKVTLTLPVAIPQDKRNSVKLYHVVGDTKEQIDILSISEDGKTITFIAPSFSAYVITYNADPIAENDITPDITVAFEQVGTKQNEYDIVLKATNGKKINGLMTADLTFALTQGTGNVSYDITPAANMNLLEQGENRFEFHFDGVNAHNVTGDRVVIGTVVFGGYCKDAEFKIDETAATNVVHTTKAENSIVDEYTTGGTKNLSVANAKVAPLTIKEETKELTIKVSFPNSVSDNAAAYQDMKVSIVSENSNEEIELGSAEAPMENGGYTITKELVKNTKYTVTVSGAGYRTARYNVMMNENKTLNFWNNVMGMATEIETGNSASEKKTTFLAGELVKDGQINIYDLSAVVSYFGQSTADKTQAWDYAKYDLDRDGTIDSRDIAYVLASWGN